MTDSAKSLKNNKLFCCWYWVELLDGSIVPDWYDGLSFKRYADFAIKKVLTQIPTPQKCVSINRKQKIKKQQN